MPVENDMKDAPNFWLSARQTREARFTSSRDVWEDEVAAMTIQLSAARSRLNVFCPIYSLPDEVLARIFEALAAISPVKGRTRQWGWVFVTHVSRRFRAAAIGHAILWSKLSIDGHTPWNIFLNRSQRALLDIHGEARSNKQSKHYATHTLRNIERVRSIEVGLIIPGWQQVIHCGAPELHTLKLEMDMEMEDESDEGSEREVEPGPQVMVLQLLTRNAPKLRKLSLAGIRMLWKLEAPIGLTSLSLRSYANQDRAQFSFADVLGCLQHMPALEYLILNTVLPHSNGRSVGMRASVPNLRLLSLAEPDKRCLDLWSFLDVPHTCSIHIEARMLDIEGATIWKSIVLDHLAKPGCPIYRRIRFGDPKSDGLYAGDGVRFSVHSALDTEDAVVGSRPSNLPFHLDPQPTLSFALSIKGPSDPFRELFGLSHTEPAYARRARVREFSRILLLMRCVNSLLNRITNLESVEVYGMSSKGYYLDPEDRALEQAFCAYFLNDSQSPSSTSDLGVERFIPSIHTLSLHCTNLGHRSFYNREDKLHDMLSEALRRRYFADMPIRSVNLYRTKVDPSWLQMWSNYVDDVNCDTTCNDSAYSYSDSGSEGTSEDFPSGDSEEVGGDSEAEWDDDESEDEGENESGDEDLD